MNKRTIEIITIILTTTSAILGVGSQIAAIPHLPGWLANAWPVVLAFALLFNQVAKAIIGETPKVPIWVIGTVILFSSVGCAELERLQAKPGVQLAETLAIQAAQSYFGNGGSSNAAWAISTGLNAMSDISTYEQQKQAANVASQAVKSFAGDPTAVNGLATKVANIIATRVPNQTPAQTAQTVQAIANGIQIAAKQQP